MARILGSVILLAAATGGSAQTAVSACDTQLTTCYNTMNAVVGQGLASGKLALCEAKAAFEKCYIAQTAVAGTCDAATIAKYKALLEATVNQLKTDGVDCLSPVQKTAPSVSSASSGDSGSEASVPSESSSEPSNTSASYPWQLVLWPLLIICCCAAIAGGVYAAMSKKKPKPKPLPTKEPVFESAPPPMAEVAVDINHDGIADAIVRGEDKDKDGIPDILQGDKNAAYSVQEVPQPVPPLPVVDTMPALDPNLFGPMMPLLPGVGVPQTTSTYMNPYAGYPMTTPTYTTAGYPAMGTAMPRYATTPAYGGYAGGVV